MKVKMQIIPIVILLLSSIAFGADKGKEQVFPFPQQAVWQACIKAASQEFTLDYSDKESGILSFSTGISLTSNGFKNSVSLKELDPGSTKVTLNVQKKGQVFVWGRSTDRREVLQSSRKDSPRRPAINPQTS